MSPCRERQEDMQYSGLRRRETTHIAKNVDQFTRTKTSGEWQGKGKNTSEQQVLVR